MKSTIEKPLVSIIVPVYNIENYVSDCLEGILRQTYDNIEIIVVNDGSSDQSGVVCEEFAKKDERIFVIQQNNKGLSEARNAGLAVCNGQYVLFVDGDDWIELDMVELLMDAVLKNEADAACCGFTFEFSNHNIIIPVVEQTTVLSGVEGLEQILNGIINEQVWNKIWKKKLFELVKFPNYCTFEDIATVWRLLLQCSRIVVIPNNCYHYRQRGDSIVHNKSADNLFWHWQNALERLDAVVALDKGLFISGLRSCIYAATIIWSNTYYFNKEEIEKNRERYKSISKYVRKHEKEILSSDYPLSLKISSLFLCSDSRLSFFCCYCVNNFYHAMKKQFGNKDAG